MNQNKVSTGKAVGIVVLGVIVLMALQYLLPVGMSLLPLSPLSGPTFGFALLNTVANLLSALGAVAAGLLVGYLIGHKSWVYGSSVGIITGVLFLVIATYYSMHSGINQLNGAFLIQALVPGLGNLIDLVIMTTVSSLAGEYLKQLKQRPTSVTATV